MKHERTSTSRSTMHIDRLAIELNSSADPSKSTPHGDEGRFWGIMGRRWRSERAAASGPQADLAAGLMSSWRSQRRSPVTTKSASRTPHCVQRSNSPNREPAFQRRVWCKSCSHRAEPRCRHSGRALVHWHCHINELSAPSSLPVPRFRGRTTGTPSVSRSRAARHRPTEHTMTA
jgi:hypothetical protein